MLAAGCSERGPAASADRDAGPAIAVAGGNTVTIAVTTAVTSTVTPAITSTSSRSATASSTASSAAPTVRECRSCRQGGHHQRKHEHTESCHVAPPP
jgi:hypothetical protein